MQELILSKEEIEKENTRMQLEDNSLVNLEAFPKVLSRKKIIDFLANDNIPNTMISKSILENRNIKNIPENKIVESGIALKRTILRYLPTKDAFYRGEIVEQNIASVIPFATPLLILYQSLDQKWYYVQTSFYRGWCPKIDILKITEQERKLFEQRKKFITITSPLIPFQHTFLDLGTTLPILGIHPFYYECFIPTSKGLEIQKIPTMYACIGFLPYTIENILEISKKYLGHPYYWGAIFEGVDCSFFIQSIFRTFGFLFPRDTISQEKVIGLYKIDLKGKTEIEKKEILESISYPAILHKKGHIMLALSNTCIIHAYGDAKKVILSNLESCYGTNLYPLLTSISCLIKNK